MRGNMSAFSLERAASHVIDIVSPSSVFVCTKPRGPADTVAVREGLL